jgi:hypothetical protein
MPFDDSHMVNVLCTASSHTITECLLWCYGMKIPYSKYEMLILRGMFYLLLTYLFIWLYNQDLLKA